MKRCLIVFAREPEKGKVKSRLTRIVPEEEVLDLYKAFVKDTLVLAKKAVKGERVLAYASSGPCPYLKKIGQGFHLHNQKGRSLGDRILEAFTFSQSKFSCDQMVIIGTDSPHLPPSLIRRSFAALKRADVVLGPCEDGGFYLLGMRKAEPGIFEGITWSSDNVLRMTLKNAKRLKLKTELLPLFFDVDTPEDLTKLRDFLNEKSDVAFETRKVIKRRYE